MSLTGGKRKVNKSLKAWVTFVKKVQKEEKLNYKDAIHRAKVRKDKGEKWMKGGGDVEDSITNDVDDIPSEMVEDEEEMTMTGGRRRRRTIKCSRSKGRGSRRSRRSRKH